MIEASPLHQILESRVFNNLEGPKTLGHPANNFGPKSQSSRLNASPMDRYHLCRATHLVSAFVNMLWEWETRTLPFPEFPLILFPGVDPRPIKGFVTFSLASLAL